MNTFDLFLIPAVNQYRKYTEIIDSLSKKYDTPSFPHVTIFEMLEAEENDLVTKVERITKGFKKIEVEIFGMNFTNTVHQCVFAQIKMSSQLLALYNELETSLQYSTTSPYFPHMSLIYGDLSSEEKSNVAKQVKLGDKLLLDKLAIYRDGPLPGDWANVAEFELN
ncbi:MAG: 2'-5' RNA ligase family protein [Candidatus Dojkabacteria bacterium]